jgi:hypothetical protein
MQCAVIVRKIGETSAMGVARVVALSTGAAATGAIVTPACAVAQIVQVWCETLESSAWECVICAVAKTPTSAIESTASALTNPPLFARIRSTPNPNRNLRGM